MYALTILLVSAPSAFVDRQLAGVQAPPKNQELGWSNKAMGLLQDIAMAVFYTAAYV